MKTLNNTCDSTEWFKDDWGHTYTTQQALDLSLWYGRHDQKKAIADASRWEKVADEYRDIVKSIL